MATPTEEVGAVDSFDDAVAAALADLGEATPEADSFDLPSDWNEAQDDDDDADVFEDADDTDDTEGGQAESDDFFAEGEEGVTSTETSDTVEIPGVGPVTVQQILEWRNSGLRMEDYTRKTQEVAELRRQLEERANADTTGNAELWQALKEDPQGTIAYLATQVGLLSEDEAPAKVRELKNVKLRPESDIEQMVQERLNQALMQHPVVQEALMTKVMAQVDAEFGQIEQRIGATLSERDRQKVMDFAAQNGIQNLDVAFDALAARTGKTFSKVTEERPAPPQKRQPGRTGRMRPVSKEPVKDFDEAVERALAELEARNEV